MPLLFAMVSCREEKVVLEAWNLWLHTASMLCCLAVSEAVAFTCSWALTVRGARGRAVVSAAGKREDLHALLRQMLLFPARGSVESHY